MKLREGWLTALLLQMCGTLGEYAALCRTAADEKLPLVLDIAAAELSPALVCPHLYPGCGGHTRRGHKVDRH